MAQQNDSPKGCLIVVGGIIILSLICWGIGSLFGASDNVGKSTNNQTQQSHECYVCGDNARLKYGSHYYCNTHWAMVKTMDEAD